MKLNGASAGNEATAYYDVEVLSGWVCTFSGYIMGDSETGESTTIRIRNIHTGSYLTSAGAWQAAAVDFGSQNAASYAQKTANFTVQPYSTSFRHKVTLRVTVEYGGSGDGYADDFALWPHWDFVSIHGHNMGGTITPEARSSDDNFVADDDKESETGFVIDYPSYYTVLDTIATDRYARLECSGTNYDPIEIGLLVFGQKSTLPDDQRIPYDILPRLSQIGFSTQGGHVSKLAMAEHESETLKLKFRLATADYETFRDEVERRSKLGTSPAVIVSDDTNGKVHYGNFGSSFPTRHILTGYYDVDCTFVEDGYVVRTT
jgi:hypothetical protein